MRTSHALLLALLAGAAAHAQAATYTFDANDQGWFASNGGSQVHVATGGNSGGFLQLTDISDDDFLLNAPVSALGNWTSLLGGTLSFDVKNINGDAPDWGDFGRVWITGGGKTVTADIVPGNNPPADGKWHTYSASFDTLTWGADLATVLSNVTSFQIKIESHNGVSEINGVDNVAFTSAVPEPASAVLLGLGLATVAWRRRRTS
ncbi:laminin B domain-containing protein [Roseateles paludis]|jgi:hypothetical protein|uniref:Laminin B domain-containing protein n=1 Tax=Roseateles paludis TaxID=3145238 RepID=A0ABV0FVI3_9BURK